MKSTWKDLNVKEKLAVSTAIAAFAIGWLLTGLAAFVPLLLSEQSILWILGQALIYTASVFGVTSYFNDETVRLRHDINHQMRRFKTEIEEEENEREENT